MKQNNDLTAGSIEKNLVLFFIPIALGTLCQQLYNTVDTMVVGKFIGTEALAAMIIALTIGFFVALTAGSSAVIAQLASGRQNKEVSLAIHSAIAFSFLAGLILTAVILPLTPAILRWMKTPGDTMNASILYLRIYFSGSIFMLVFNMGSSILQAVGDSSHPLYYLIACCFCNIILDLVFVVGLQMGIAGAAWATLLSQLLSALLILHRFCRLKNKYRLTLSQLRIDKILLARMLRIGIPSGLQASMYNVSNVIIQVAINSLLTVAVAAWSISNKVNGFYSSIGTALSVAVMGFVGQNYGAGRTDRVRKTLWVSLKLFLPMTVGLALIVLGIGRFGLMLFVDDPSVIACTQEILWYLAPFYLIWTVIEIVSGTLRGVGDAMVPLIIAGVGICVIRILWVWCIFPFIHSIGGLSLCYPITWTITCAALCIYYHKQGWLRPSRS